MSRVVNVPYPAGEVFDKTGLIAWWDFEDNGEDSHDSKDLTNVGTPAYVEGKVGQAANFNGSTNHWEINSDSDMQTGNVDFTFGGWFYATSNSAVYFIAGKAPNSGSGYEWQAFLLGVTTPKKVRFAVFRSDGGDAIIASLDLNYSANTWYFYRGWYVASEKKCYVDVNESGTPAVSGAAAFTPTAGNKKLVIGNGYDPSGVSGINGYMDSVFFFKRVLTTEEGAYIYNNGDGRDYAEL